MFQKRLQFFRSILYLADLALVVLCWMAAYLLRFYAPVIPVTKGVPDPVLYLLLLILVLVVYAVVFPVSGLYQRPWARTRQSVWPVLRASTTGVVVAVTLTYFLRPYDFSRLVFVQFWVLLTVCMLVYRPQVRHAWARRHNQRQGDAVLIVGIEDLGRMMAHKIRQHPELGLTLAGFLTRRPELVGSQVDDLPVLGRCQDINAILAQQQVQMVIIALPMSSHADIREVMDNVADEMVDIKIVPDFYRFITLHGTVEEFEGLPIIGLRGSPLEGLNSAAKRGLDILGSLALLALFGLPMLIIALGVKLTSRGPVFYRQERMGLDGRVFNMLKFRSMRMDAEAQTGPVWAAKDDPRRTRLGACIRATSMDELPQLFNVLKGEMSLVGPRPERPEFIREFRSKVPGYMLRHKVKAGITGWAQINGWRGNTSLERRIQHDLYYIENWSLKLDLKILILTPFRGLINPNAY